MAGIGFELNKILRQNTYYSLFKAYGLTTLMVSGPFLFILVSIGIIYFYTSLVISNDVIVQQFLTILVYLFSTSMIMSSFLQFTFFRFIADKTFIKDFNPITPNYIGVLLIQLIIALCFALPIVFYFFANYSMLLQIMLISSFAVLCMIFVSIVLLTGLKSYRRIILAFAFSYSIMIIMFLLLDKHELMYLLAEFLITQTILFILLAQEILGYYPTAELISFEFLRDGNFHFTIAFSNLFYNLGFWIDKYMFWYNPNTSLADFPPLRFSPIYDLPMFIAYLTIIPATATFLLQVESKFSIIYPKFMETIFRKKTLGEIDAIRNELTYAGRDAVYSLFKTQSVILVVMFLSASYIFTVFHIIPLYLNLLFILTVAAGLNVVLWGLLNILYYTTRYMQAFYVSLIFMISNFSFTLLSFYAGPGFFGYGFSFSLLLSIAFALAFLNEVFKDLDYSTFMMAD